MTRLSSRMTYPAKIAFSVGFIGFPACFIVAALLTTQNEPLSKRLIFFVAPFFVAAVGYAIMRQTVFPLISQVYRQGNDILCRNGGKEARFSLNDIQNAIYYTQSQPPKCVLRLRQPTVFGREIQFMPSAGANLLAANAEVLQLVDEVDRLNHEKTSG